MKKTVIIVLLAAMAVQCRAQTFSEWFRQKSTQTKYLLEQIAALQVYIGYLRKGYTIVKDGLHTISDIKQGDLNLHTDYFNSLKNVNPAIASYPRVKDILDIQKAILRLTNKSRRQFAHTNVFTGSELQYIDKVYDRLLTDCQATIDQLQTVTTPGKLEMKDDERLRRINLLYQDAQSQYGFAKHFSNGTMTMAIERQKELNNINDSRILYGIQK